MTETNKEPGVDETKEPGVNKTDDTELDRVIDARLGSHWMDDEEQKLQRWQNHVVECERLVKEESFDEAEHSGLRALEIAETFAGDDQRLGVTLELLSTIYYRDARYHFGAPVLMRLLQLYRRRLGQDHMDTATVTHNAALLYHAWRKLDEAMVFYQQAMCIKSAKLGLEHPDVEAIRDHYGNYLQEASRIQTARKYKPLPDEKLSDALAGSAVRDEFTLSGQFDALPREMFE
jgi:tetratricopeptide (TPR) repeat protein